MSKILTINDGMTSSAFIDTVVETVGRIASDEEWAVSDISPLYAVSNYGRVVRGPYDSVYFLRDSEVVQHYDMRLLNPALDSDGYPVVGIRINDEYKSIHVHRLVATAFIPNPDDKPTVNHIDGNKQNNYISNLEWATWQENNKHAISTGLRKSVVPVKCLDTGETYESMGEAARMTGLDPEAIRQSILGRFRLEEGYTFIKLDGSVVDEDAYMHETFHNWLFNFKNGKVPIKCLDAGVSFDSVAAAARWAHVDSGAIDESILKKSVCKGHVFVREDQIILDEQRYMDYCYTRSKFYKSLASKPTHSLYDKAIVLNSGGMDSTTCLSIAINELGADNVSTISIYYKQKHSKELEQSKKIAEFFGVKHYELDLSSLYDYSDCSLLQGSSQDIVDESYADQIAKNGEGKVSTYVPFRNGLMISSVAAIAQSVYPDEYVAIYLGAHADDAAGEAYADCSPRFVSTMSKAIAIGTYYKVGVEAPLVNLTKAQVCKIGLKLSTPYHLTTSCYHGREKACGVCGTCRDRIAAFRANGAIDPIEYEEDPFADMREAN